MSSCYAKLMKNKKISNKNPPNGGFEHSDEVVLK